MRHALLDTGPLVALFDDRDQFHAHFHAMLGDVAQPLNLHTTWPCVVEASHMLGDTARVEMLKWVGLGGAVVIPFDASGLLDMTDLMLRYTAQPRTRMDLADASLCWLAQQSGVTTILTLDVRDFSRYRLPDGRGFNIL
ncbi:MAG: PIN domain-containing protein [Steroidobacteraceae bacterium]